MELNFVNCLGIFAACLTTGAFVPQAYKTWKTRSTGDLSLGMFLMLFIGTVSWFVYGFLKMDIPILGANGITLCLAFVILYFKVKELRAKKARRI